MARYMSMPNVKVTLGSTEYENVRNFDVSITRLENGFDTATVVMDDYKSSLYPSVVTSGTAIQIDVKDDSESAYPTNPVFKGVVRFPILPYSSDGEKIILKCDGSGYGFGDTIIGEEYGSQSSNPTMLTAASILTDTGVGLISCWVNSIMAVASSNSGFAYTNSISATLSDSILFLNFPYKPCNKAIDDICDLLSAIRQYASNKGPHWIVTTDDKFQMKTIDEDSATWHLYYNAATAGNDCKLYQDIDFTDYNFEKMGPEANYVLYYGAWRRPSNGDAWTENSFTDWGIGAQSAGSNEGTTKIVGSYSIECHTTGNPTGPISLYYPSAQTAAWDLSSFTNLNTPYLNFYVQRQDGFLTSVEVRLAKDAAHYFSCTLSLTDHSKWYHFSLPVGPYFRTQGVDDEFLWTDNAGDWSTVNYFEFVGTDATKDKEFYLDGLHFGDANVCRVARKALATITTEKMKGKVITDQVGKDDTLKAGTKGTTDVGLMARMAQSELYRLYATTLVGTVTVPMIKDVLPGQRFQIYAKKTAGGTYNINGTDMRVTKLEHNMGASGFTTTLHLTDDVSNSHPRPPYENWNKIMAANRPEFQDRQASSLKADTVDVNLTRLEEEY